MCKVTKQLYLSQPTFWRFVRKCLQKWIKCTKNMIIHRINIGWLNNTYHAAAQAEKTG